MIGKFFLTLALIIVPSFGQYNVDIRFVNQNISPSVRQAFTNAVARWGEVITGDLRDVTFTSTRTFRCGGESVTFRSGETLDDLVIVANIAPIDGPGSILGQAGPCTNDREGFARIGVMSFDSADLASLEQRGTLEAVILHEMGHVIGIGTKWQRLNSNFQYVGTGGIRGLSQIGGSGRPLIENTGGAGTRGGHWRESTYQNELMTGFLSGDDQPLSSLTVESLTDLGYQVNSNSADAFTVPSSSISARDGDRIENDVMEFEETYTLDFDGTVTVEKNPNYQATSETTTGTIVMYAGIGFACACAAFVVVGAVFTSRNRGSKNQPASKHTSVVAAPNATIVEEL